MVHMMNDLRNSNAFYAASLVMSGIPLVREKSGKFVFSSRSGNNEKWSGKKKCEKVREMSRNFQWKKSKRLAMAVFK